MWLTTQPFDHSHYIPKAICFWRGNRRRLSHNLLLSFSCYLVVATQVEAEQVSAYYLSSPKSQDLDTVQDTAHFYHHEIQVQARDWLISPSNVMALPLQMTVVF